jgi:hypothetical protein
MSAMRPSRKSIVLFKDRMVANCPYEIFNIIVEKRPIVKKKVSSVTATPEIPVLRRRKPGLKIQKIRRKRMLKFSLS